MKKKSWMIEFMNGWYIDLILGLIILVEIVCWYRMGYLPTVAAIATGFNIGTLYFRQMLKGSHRLIEDLLTSNASYRESMNQYRKEIYGKL